MFPGETILSGADPRRMSLKVLHSAAGFYLGTEGILDPDMGPHPYTRESGYFGSEEEAREALTLWLRAAHDYLDPEGYGDLWVALRKAYERGLLPTARV